MLESQRFWPLLPSDFFYILTLYIGLGAMTNGVIDVESSNMAAPLLADKFNFILFAIVSAIAFATVLGTVSGLIVASAGSRCP
jgi:cation/acetate symporter